MNLGKQKWKATQRAITPLWGKISTFLRKLSSFNEPKSFKRIENNQTSKLSHSLMNRCKISIKPSHSMPPNCNRVKEWALNKLGNSSSKEIVTWLCQLTQASWLSQSPKLTMFQRNCCITSLRRLASTMGLRSHDRNTRTKITLSNAKKSTYPVKPTASTSTIKADQTYCSGLELCKVTSKRAVAHQNSRSSMPRARWQVQTKNRQDPCKNHKTEWTCRLK